MQDATAPTKRTQKIVSRWDSSKVLFECELPEGMDSSVGMRHALEIAASGKSDLRSADLGGANLVGAYLRSADLGGAYLRSADLGGAYLGDAYLSGADLGGAYLVGAYLRSADLGGAYLGDSACVQRQSKQSRIWIKCAQSSSTITLGLG